MQRYAEALKGCTKAVQYQRAETLDKDKLRNNIYKVPICVDGEREFA